MSTDSPTSRFDIQRHKVVEMYVVEVPERIPYSADTRFERHIAIKTEDGREWKLFTPNTGTVVVPVAED